MNQDKLLQLHWYKKDPFDFETTISKIYIIT